MSDYGPYNQGGGSGGGGYVTNSPYGASASQDSPGSRAKQPAASLRPVTILQILNAVQAHTDAEFTIDDSEPSQLTFVAQVISCVAQVTTIVLQVTDGTGQMDVRQWLESAEEGEKKKEAIGEMGWVRILGTIRSFNNKRQITAARIHPITDMNEIFFHQLEALSVHLYYTKGAIEATGGISAAGGATSAYTAGGTGGAATEAYPDLDDLQRAIMTWMKNSAAGDEGLHVVAIAQGVAKRFGMDAATISGAIDRLLDDGYIFQTVDDEHYAVAE